MFMSKITEQLHKWLHNRITKSCPHCKSNQGLSVRAEEPHKRYYYVYCDVCGASGSRSYLTDFDTELSCIAKSEAIAKWNWRKEDD